MTNITHTTSRVVLIATLLTIYCFAVISSSTCDNPVKAPPNAPTLTNPLAIPLLATDYIDAIKAQSIGACPVRITPESIVSFNEQMSEISYFVVNTKGNMFRHSLGYMYYSYSKKLFRWDETFLLDYEYDMKHAGSQLYESALANGTDSTLIDIATLPNGDVHCVQAPNFPFMSIFDIFNSTVSEYIGITNFPEDVMTGGIGPYDVYAVKDRWFAPSTIIFYYVNRNNAKLQIQLYHQSTIAEPSNPNYFWDFAKQFKNGQAALSAFNQHQSYYFTLPSSLMQHCIH